ncbi:MAG: bi-domain-containing oxidoreductase, partial [Candidatus Babeliales bacterium]
MRQLFLEKGIIAVKDVCEPILDDNSVLVEVYYSCISPGTEGSTIANAQQSVFSNIPLKLPKVLLSIAKNGIEGTKALIREKLAGNLQALGYSCSGKVIAVGKNIKKYRAGDFVACAGAGFAHHAEMVIVPENLVTKVSSEEYLRQASTTTLGAIALQGLRRADVKLGDTVCVLGLGLLGQFTVQLAKISGCKVIALDLLKNRLDLALKLGADTVLNPAEVDIKKEIEFVTAHQGVDCTIITAGSSHKGIIQQSMEITRKKGRVVLVGDVPLTFDRSPFYQKEIDFLISCSYGPGRYDASYEQNGLDYPYAYVRWTENRNMESIVDLIERKKLDVDSLISQEASLDQAEKAYDSLKSQDVLAVVLSYRTEEHELAPHQEEAVQKESVPLEEIRFVPAFKDRLRVGVVGAGGFAKVKLMPIISRIKNVKINAVVDANMANSITVSKTYGAAKALSDDSKLFDEDLVDAVLIASPHKYHSKQALAALQHGKAVFLEKPMVTDFDQLHEMKAFFEKNSSLPFCVDYNRSFAPFVQKIKKEVAKRSSPLVVHYRMNAGFIPKNHWIQTEVGAGRIIGEACHIFDLFVHLTDSYPVALSVE